MSVVPPPPAGEEAAAASHGTQEGEEARLQQPPSALQAAATLPEAADNRNGSSGPVAAGGAAASGLAGLLSSEAVGKLCLLGVALLWGSYNPMLRLLYSQDGPPGPVAIMLFRGVLQAGVLVAIYTWKSNSSSAGSSSSSSDGSSSNGSSTSSSNGNAGSVTALQPAAPAAASTSGGGASASDSSSLVPAWALRLSSKMSFTAIGALELGTWLFLATGIQVGYGEGEERQGGPGSGGMGKPMHICIRRRLSPGPSTHHPCPCLSSPTLSPPACPACC